MPHVWCPKIADQILGLNTADRFFLFPLASSAPKQKKKVGGEKSVQMSHVCGGSGYVKIV